MNAIVFRDLARRGRM